AGVLWWQRAPLNVWYAARGLSRASEADREAWLGRVLACDAEVVPPLIGRLAEADARGCANVEAALLRLIEKWQDEAAKRDELFDSLANAFPRASAPGQQVALAVVASPLTSAGLSRESPRALAALARMIRSIVQKPDAELQAEAFKLVRPIVERSRGNSAANS